MWPFSCFPGVRYFKRSGSSHVSTQAEDANHILPDGSIASPCAASTLPVLDATILCADYAQSLFPVACIAFEAQSGLSLPHTQFAVLWHNATELDLWHQLLRDSSNPGLREAMVSVIQQDHPAAQVVTVPWTAFAATTRLSSEVLGALSVPVHVSLVQFVAQSPHTNRQRALLLVCKAPLLTRRPDMPQGRPPSPPAAREAAAALAAASSGLSDPHAMRDSGQQPAPKTAGPPLQDDLGFLASPGGAHAEGGGGGDMGVAGDGLSRFLQHRQRDSMVAAHLPAIITVYTLDGQVLHQNPASEEYLGPMPSLRTEGSSGPVAAAATGALGTLAAHGTDTISSGAGRGGRGGAGDAATEDPGGDDAEWAASFGVLGAVFQFEQAKLRQMIDVLFNHSSVWQGIVRVPPSSLLRQKLLYSPLHGGPKSVAPTTGGPMVGMTLSADQVPAGAPATNPLHPPAAEVTRMRSGARALSQVGALAHRPPPLDTSLAPADPAAYTVYTANARSQPSQQQRHLQVREHSHGAAVHPPHPLAGPGSLRRSQLVSPRAESLPHSDQQAFSLLDSGPDTRQAVNSDTRSSGVPRDRRLRAADEGESEGLALASTGHSVLAGLRTAANTNSNTNTHMNTLGLGPEVLEASRGSEGAALMGVYCNTGSLPSVPPPGRASVARGYDTEADPLATSTWTVLADRSSRPWTGYRSFAGLMGSALRPRTNSKRATVGNGDSKELPAVSEMGLTRRWGSSTQPSSSSHPNNLQPQVFGRLSQPGTGTGSDAKGSGTGIGSPPPRPLTRAAVVAAAAAVLAVADTAGSGAGDVVHSGMLSTHRSLDAGGELVLSGGAVQTAPDGAHVRWMDATTGTSPGPVHGTTLGTRNGGTLGAGATACTAAAAPAASASAGHVNSTGTAGMSRVLLFASSLRSAPFHSAGSPMGSANANSGGGGGRALTRVFHEAAPHSSQPPHPHVGLLGRAASSRAATAAAAAAGGGGGNMGTPEGPLSDEPTLSGRIPAATKRAQTSNGHNPHLLVGFQPSPPLRRPATAAGTAAAPDSHPVGSAQAAAAAAATGAGPGRRPGSRGDAAGLAANAMRAVLMARQSSLATHTESMPVAQGPTAGVGEDLTLSVAANARLRESPASATASAMRGTAAAGEEGLPSGVEAREDCGGGGGGGDSGGGGGSPGAPWQIRPSPVDLLRADGAPAHRATAAADEGGDELAAADSTYDTWHEISAVVAQDPVTGSMVLVVTQVDVTAKVRAERHLVHVMCAERRLLLQLFPRHVLQHVVDANPLLHSGAASLEALPREWLDGGDWRPVLRDCDKLATMHPQATVLFADIAGFDDICMELPPQKVLAFLNDLFAKFDSSIEPFGVHKMETIGGLFIVAGGLLREEEDGAVAVRERWDPLHAEKVFMFAKAMLAVAAKTKLPTIEEPVKLRIGIHTGPVMSGIVGTRVPRFVLFGDTVNTASRMQTTCTPGTMHVSEDTRALLPHENWTPTGGVQIKGKGLLNTYVWAPEEQIHYIIPPYTNTRGSSSTGATTNTTTAAANASARPLSTAAQHMNMMETMSVTSSDAFLAQQLSFSVVANTLQRNKSRFRTEPTGYL